MNRTRICLAALTLALVLLLGMAPTAHAIMMDPTDTVCMYGGDHQWMDWVTDPEPGCITEGRKTRYCGVCQYQQTETIPALGHDFRDDWSVMNEPGCETDGMAIRFCHRCQQEETRSIPALGHDWDGGKVTKETSCRENGIITYTCNRCGATKTENIPLGPHEWELRHTQAPTCTEGGFELYGCKHCNADKTIDLASDLVEYLNTRLHTADQLQEEFYKLACSWSLGVESENVYVHITGLAENMEKAMALVEEIMSDVQPDDEALQMLVERIIKSRNDNKTNQRAAFRALNMYGIYGEDYVHGVTESDAQLRAYTAKQLCDAIHNLFSYKHRVLYYGPLSLKEATAAINRIHTVKPVKDVPANKVYQPEPTNENTILFVNYDAKNIYLTEYFRGEHFNTALMPQVNLVNEYFGGSMNAIVFQEMREKRSLAYSASSYYTYNGRRDGFFMNQAQIITQTDKLFDALDAYEELFNDMPQAEANFNLAKDALIAGSRTARTTKFGIISAYLQCEKMGWKEPLRKQLFAAYQKFTMQDLINFQQRYIKGQHKTYLILGKESEIDFNALSRFGKVKKLTLDDIFGY